MDSGGLRMRDMVLLLHMLRLDMLLVRRGLGLLLNVLGMLLRMLVHMLGLDMLGMLRMLLLRRVLRHGHGRLDGALVLLLLMVLLGRGLLGMWGGTVGAVVGSLVAAIQVRLGILVLLSVKVIADLLLVVGGAGLPIRRGVRSTHGSDLPLLHALNG